jgi:hypothetical protein
MFSRINLSSQPINIEREYDSAKYNMNKILNGLNILAPNCIERNRNKLQNNKYEQFMTMSMKAGLGEQNNKQKSKKQEKTNLLFKTIVNQKSDGGKKEIMKTKLDKEKENELKRAKKVIKRLGHTNDGFLNSLLMNTEKGFDFQKFLKINMFQILMPESANKKRINEKRVSLIPLINIKKFDKNKKDTGENKIDDLNLNFDELNGKIEENDEQYTQTLDTQQNDYFSKILSSNVDAPFNKKYSNLTERKSNIFSGRYSNLNTIENFFTTMKTEESQNFNGTKTSFRKTGKTFYTSQMNSTQTSFEKFNRIFKNKIFTSFDFLKNNLEEIEGTLKLEKKLGEEVIRNENIIIKTEKRPEIEIFKEEFAMDNKISYLIGKGKGQYSKFVFDYIKDNKKHEIKEEALNNVNSDTVFKFRKMIINENIKNNSKKLTPSDEIKFFAQMELLNRKKGMRNLKNNSDRLKKLLFVINCKKE